MKLIAVLVASTLSGCTLLGAAIGSSPSVTKRTEVENVSANEDRHAQCVSRGVGYCEQLPDDYSETRFDEHITVETDTANGAIVGAVIDLLILGSAVALLASMPMPGSMN